MKKNALKLTFDLTEKNRDILETVKSINRISYGTLLNRLIGTFGDLPDSVRESLIDFCFEKAHDAYVRMSQAGPIMFAELKRDAECYNNIFDFLNGGGYVCGTSKGTLSAHVQRIPISCGELICPEDWVCVNPDMAGVSVSACVIEAGGPYTKYLPHLVFLMRETTVMRHSDLYRKNICELCCEVCPEFRPVCNGFPENITFYDIPVFGQRQQGGSSIVRDAIIVRKDDI